MLLRHGFDLHYLEIVLRKQLNRYNLILEFIQLHE